MHNRNRTILVFQAAFVTCFILIPALSSEAGIPGIRSINLLYWSDPLLIAVAASLGYALALWLRLLPKGRSPLILYLLLVPMTVAVIPSAWLFESAISAVAGPFNFASDSPNSLSRWLVSPDYWYLDSRGEDRSLFRIGLLVVSFVIGLMYQTLLIDALSRDSKIRDSFLAALTITGTAYGALLVLSFTPLFPYSTMIWPR